ncbi:BlaI/MecI/CopY family transcriptional regulator [Planctomycetota bacterium]
MAKKGSNLGELELVVLKTIWEHQPCTVKQIAKILGKRRGCAKTTVLTVMQRLHAKNYLKRRKVGGLYQYSPTEERGKVISKLISRFLDKVLDGSPAPFVAYLLETEDLSPKQIAALRKIAQELEKKEGETS